MPKPVRKMQKANAAAQAAVLPKISPELLDQLVKGPMTAEAIDDASRAFKKALIERALGAEMSHHLGYAAGSEKPEAATNHRRIERKVPMHDNVPEARRARPVHLRHSDLGLLREAFGSFANDLQVAHSGMKRQRVPCKRLAGHPCGELLDQAAGVRNVLKIQRPVTRHGADPFRYAAAGAV